MAEPRQYLVTIEPNDDVPNEMAEAAVAWVVAVFDRDGLWTTVNDKIVKLQTPAQRRVTKGLVRLSVDIHHG